MEEGWWRKDLPSIPGADPPMHILTDPLLVLGDFESSLHLLFSLSQIPLSLEHYVLVHEL